MQKECQIYSLVLLVKSVGLHNTFKPTHRNKALEVLHPSHHDISHCISEESFCLRSYSKIKCDEFSNRLDNHNLTTINTSYATGMIAVLQCSSEDVFLGFQADSENLPFPLKGFSLNVGSLDSKQISLHCMSLCVYHNIVIVQRTTSTACTCTYFPCHLPHVEGHHCWGLVPANPKVRGKRRLRNKKGGDRDRKGVHIAFLKVQCFRKLQSLILKNAK